MTDQYTPPYRITPGILHSIEQIGEALEAGLIEMVQPGVPRARNQKYRLTSRGLQLLNKKGT